MLIMTKRDRIFISHVLQPEGKPLWGKSERAEAPEHGEIWSDLYKGTQSEENNLTTFSSEKVIQPSRIAYIVETWKQDIQRLTEASQDVTYQAETLVYLHNLVVFLRAHEAVSWGVTPISTQHLELLGRKVSHAVSCRVLTKSRCLACINDTQFVSPGLIKLAAKKVYLHRISMTTPESQGIDQDRSNSIAFRQAWSGQSPERIIDEVLEDIQVPL